MKIHKSACSAALESNIEELNRRNDLESLRPFVAAEQCFPPNKDVTKTPITYEELKKLARAWKLHERRNFWKTHTNVDQMVKALKEVMHQMEESRKFQVSAPNVFYHEVASDLTIFFYSFDVSQLTTDPTISQGRKERL